MIYGAAALAVVVDALAASPDPDASEIGRRLDLVRDGRIASADAALGLVGNWRLTRAIEQRNDLIAGIAARHYPDSSNAATAADIASALRRYRSTAWRADRVASSNPHPAGSIKADLFETLKLVDRPLSPETIREIVGDRKGMFSPNE